MASPKLEPAVLSAEERQVLEGWARRRKTSQALALRSRIVLACADPLPGADQRVPGLVPAHTTGARY